MNNVQRDIILNLPVSVRSWFILNDYIKTQGDLSVFKKIIADYALECPVKEMLLILSKAEGYFSKEEVSELFQLYLEISSVGG